MIWNFDSHDASEALSVRQDFMTALRAQSRARIDVFAAELIFSELVGNVVRHAPGPIRVSLDFDGDDAVLEVHDEGPGFVLAPTLPASLDSEGGRGLFIVAELAKEIRVEMRNRDGVSVCAVLPEAAA
ncbi:MAG TPA: ATP-binding protein [Candidatus Baltobacteraceae bacterium]